MLEGVKKITKLRKKIDKIDRRITCLLEERFKIATEIGRIKKLNKLPLRDKKREEEIFKKILNSKSRFKLYIKDIFKKIIFFSSEVQR